MGDTQASASRPARWQHRSKLRTTVGAWEAGGELASAALMPVTMQAPSTGRPCGSRARSSERQGEEFRLHLLA